MMDWLDDLALWQLSLIWAAASLLVGLLAGRVIGATNPSEEFPLPTPANGRVDFAPLESAIAALQANADAGRKAARPVTAEEVRRNGHEKGDALRPSMVLKRDGRGGVCRERPRPTWRVVH